MEEHVTDRADVTVIVTAIPPRVSNGMLDRAIDSIKAQDLLPEHVIVIVDHDREGPAILRNRALARADTKWVAFLDDDDEFYPQHVNALTFVAENIDGPPALVYPWFDIVGPSGEIENWRDPLKVDGEPAFGKPFTARSREIILGAANFIPVTCLVRREAFVDVGGFPIPGSQEWPHRDCEDWGAWQRMLRAGYRFAHLAERTWAWHHHSKNTSGRGDRW